MIDPSDPSSSVSSVPGSSVRGQHRVTRRRQHGTARRDVTGTGRGTCGPANAPRIVRHARRRIGYGQLKSRCGTVRSRLRSTSSGSRQPKRREFAVETRSSSFAPGSLETG